MTSPNRFPTYPALVLVAASLCLCGCGDEAGGPVASVPPAPLPLGLKAVLAAPGSPAAGASASAPSIPVPVPAPDGRRIPRVVARASAGSMTRPVAVPQPVAARQPEEAGKAQGLVPTAFETAPEAPPASAAAYAQAAPVQPQGGQVNDLLSVLTAGRRSGAPAAPPALLPQAQGAVDPARGADGAAQRVSPVESVRASVQGPQTTMRVLSAPGMVTPDGRVMDALERRRRGAPADAGAPPSQKDLEGLF